MTIPISDQQKIKLLNSDDVFTVMRDILLREEKIDQEKEHFWLISMANNYGILSIELISLGSVKATYVEPMNVYRVAVMKGAVKVIFVHNHPSGELRPSEVDRDITDRLIQVGRILNIEAIDHIIISTNSYLSFADSGLFEKLKESTKWVPPFEQIEMIKREEKRIREEAITEERQKGVATLSKHKISVGKKLLKKGMSMDEVSVILTLSAEEISKIKS